MSVFVDNDGNEIITSLVAASAEVGADVQVQTHAAVDIMSCASVDVVSSATPKGYFQETRQEYGATTSVGIADVLTLSAGGVYSLENDYSSLSGNLGVNTELFRRNTTLAVGYGFTDSDVGRAHDPGFHRDLDSHVVTASWTQTWTPELIAQFSYFLGVLEGYQSSPYRLARVADGTSRPESVPNRRVRNALVLRVRGALPHELYLAGDYRVYSDSWGISSHTGEVDLSHKLLSWLTWRVRDRVYFQTGAGFYQGLYGTARRYMTADRELGSFFSNLVGAKVSADIRFSKTVTLVVDVKFDFTWSRFEDFAALPERLMYVTELGAALSF